MTPRNLNKYYSPNEVAEIYSVSLRTVYRWINENRLPGTKQLSTRAIRIPEKALDYFNRKNPNL